MKKSIHHSLLAGMALLCSAAAIPAGAQEKYHNPVINHDAPDPTVVRGTDGAFYLGSTGRLIPIWKSYNLADWAPVGHAFTDKTDPSNGSIGLTGKGTWAPDISYVDGKYVIYFALSDWGGEWEAGIGCAWSNNPWGPYVEPHKLFSSKEIGVQNSIDPCYFEDEGHKYLFWGSFHGLYAIELSEDGLHLNECAHKIMVAGEGSVWESLEGVMILKRNGYYYLIGSNGTCCEGAKSTYNLVVVRSRGVYGPYYNKEGKSALCNNYTSILKGNKAVNGPGHNAEIITDDNGQDWILYHGYDANEPDKGRKVWLDPVNWVDGWPTIGTGTPSAEGPKPHFNLPKGK